MEQEIYSREKQRGSCGIDAEHLRENTARLACSGGSGGGRTEVIQNGEALLREIARPP